MGVLSKNPVRMLQKYMVYTLHDLYKNSRNILNQKPTSYLGFWIRHWGPVVLFPLFCM